MRLSSGIAVPVRQGNRTVRLLALAATAGLLAAACSGVSGSRTNAAGAAAVPDAGKALKAKAQAAYGALPISFEANAGQTDAQVNFLARGTGYSLFLTPSESVMALQMPTAGGKAKSAGSGAKVSPSQAAVLRLQLLGANPGATPIRGASLPGKVNYFIGNGASQWRTNVATYGDVAYKGVYPGVDLRYSGTQGRLEYTFAVAPGVDPATIRLGIAGATGVSLAANGELVMQTAAGAVRQQKPILYQDVYGQRIPVSGSFLLRDSHEVGFAVGAYNSAFPLIIDPTLVYSTYVGGTANDFGFGIAVDAAGNAYLGGQTGSTVFPRGGGGDPAPVGTTPGAFQTTYGGGPDDAFVVKMNPTGTALVYATYIGGHGTDAGFALAIDAQGDAYLAGATDSADDPGTTAVEAGFPTTDGTNGTVKAYKATCGTDGFCNNKLPANFSHDACDPLVPTCDPTNPSSPGYLVAICPPATNPTGCATPPGQSDNFLSKLSPAGDKLLYSTYIGGSSAETGADEVPYGAMMGLAVRGSTAYLTGTTFSADFPTTAKAFQPSCASCASGASDGYLSLIDTTVGGSAGLVHSTFLGGSGFDEPRAVAVDTSGNAYITGTVTGVDSSPGGTTFPVKNPLTGTYLGSGAYDGSTYKGGYSDAFVVKINPKAWSRASSLVYSFLLGGGGKDEGWSIAVGTDAVYVTGYTASGKNPHGQVEDPAHPGACAAAADPVTGVRPFCDFASDPLPYFPVTAGAYQTTFAGRATTDSGSTLFLDGDAFVAKISSPSHSPKLAYSTFVGGPNADYGQAIAVDSLGQAYITGWTTCRSQANPAAVPPVVPPPQFDPDGTPTGRNPGEPVATNVADCPNGFPTVNAPAGLAVMNSHNNDNHINDSPTAAFVTKLLPKGNGVVYSLLLDGDSFDRGFAIAVREFDATGARLPQPEAYVAGRTGRATNFPITPGAYDTTYNGAGRDTFITKLAG